MLVSHPGPVPEDAAHLPLLGAAAAAHRALVWEEEGRTTEGKKQRKVGRFSLTVATVIREKQQHDWRRNRGSCSQQPRHREEKLLN